MLHTSSILKRVKLKLSILTTNGFNKLDVFYNYNFLNYY